MSSTEGQYVWIAVHDDHVQRVLSTEAAGLKFCEEFSGLDPVKAPWTGSDWIFEDDDEIVITLFCEIVRNS